jgi:hypothetical protein
VTDKSFFMAIHLCGSRVRDVSGYQPHHSTALVVQRRKYQVAPRATPGRADARIIIAEKGLSILEHLGETHMVN